VEGEWDDSSNRPLKPKRYGIIFVPRGNHMPTDNKKAWSEFRRMLLWIALAGVLMVIGALWYLSLYDALYPSAILAAIGGVFLSTLLGCGLFAAAFFSDKSGHDANVSSAARQDDEKTD
jgi:hypothetical protein